MPDLTEKARKHLATGAVTGPGTGVCVTCAGRKEDSRLNSATCRACQRGVVTVALKVELPVDVLDALKAEAGAHGQVAAERAAFLLTKKYRK